MSSGGPLGLGHEMCRPLGCYHCRHTSTVRVACYLLLAGRDLNISVKSTRLIVDIPLDYLTVSPEDFFYSTISQLSS